MPTAIKAHTISMATAATLSSAIDLDTTPRWLTLQVPTMASSADIKIYTSETSTGTYRQLCYQGATAPALYSITSSITNCAVPLPTYGRFLKIQLTTATVDTPYTFVIQAGT